MHVGRMHLIHGYGGAATADDDGEAISTSSAYNTDIFALFSDEAFDLSTSGVFIILSHALAAPAIGYIVYRVVHRARKVLDFASTFYGIHLLTCTYIARFPRVCSQSTFVPLYHGELDDDDS